MQRRTTLLLGSLWLSAPAVALAQAVQKKVRIGILFGDAPMPHEDAALREGLRELGFVEGRNLVIERRYAEGRLQLVPGYTRELASMNLDAVIATCTPTTRLAREAFGSTPDSTPIIMAAVADPVGQQLISSLAKPGANVTGLASQAGDIMPKMLELFAGVLPRPTTVAVLLDSSSAVHPRMWGTLVPIAQRLNLQLIRVEAGRGHPGTRRCRPHSRPPCASARPASWSCRTSPSSSPGVPRSWRWRRSTVFPPSTAYGSSSMKAV